MSNTSSTKAKGISQYMSNDFILLIVRLRLKKFPSLGCQVGIAHSPPWPVPVTWTCRTGHPDESFSQWKCMSNSILKKKKKNRENNFVYWTLQKTLHDDKGKLCLHFSNSLAGIFNLFSANYVACSILKYKLAMRQARGRPRGWRGGRVWSRCTRTCWAGLFKSY